MNRKYPHFAIPEIYGDSLSYYELLRKLVEAMNVVIENYDTIPDQIAEAVANLDASQLFSAVLKQLIESIATDNTKSANAVKVYKKHDLLYATFNETVNLYESLIDFTAGTETELIIGTNIREVNISELFIELRKIIDEEARACEQADTTLQRNIDNEAQARTQADTTLQRNIDNEEQARTQADQTLQTNIDNEAQARSQADNTKANKSDVLTLEQIQATSDLSGKIASAEALKNVNDILNTSIEVPYSVSGNKEAIINNVKHVCSVIEPEHVRLLRIINGGSGFVIGISYEKTNDPSYALFLYAHIFSSRLFVVRSNNHSWSVIALDGSEL